MKYSKAEKRFQFINLLSIVALFVLILAGGVVRSTGSGMGCPDWPKCFGQYIPPVKEAQLPANYRTQFAANQLKKNQHFAKLLNAFGYTSLASKIKSDASIVNHQQEQFNAAKTWTEYINRLIGAITGILLLLTAAYSFYYWKNSKVIVFLSVINLVLVAFQAWLGSIVVSSNLVPWIVTAHMLIALGILAISIYTWHQSKLLHLNKKIKTKAFVLIITGAALILDIVQITIGTEVREKIDEYSGRLNGSFRQEWINGASKVLDNHKNLALIVIIVNVLLYLVIRKNFIKSSVQQQLMSASFVIIMLQAFAGAILTYWSLPPVAQIAHIILASLLFGAQFYLLLNLFKSAETLGAKYEME
ncbi:COX15/CtaA family protein [Mucilaginibacter arboris]|uniref:Heme A synthase n=1 Tax=Mucilaginibacter arboris TaxID=2682090 RepID=A0A7K1SUY9_9SPHI|nr:COX15/CtaA family protein [Mucilaginibacter arboris]MVN21146.1 heme A synthase [Mucilaginibacter arboris]